MQPLSAIVINWTGTPLSNEQMLVVQDAALDFESDDPDIRMVFEHPLCEGVIRCMGRLQHGAYRGTRFVATLDAEDGNARTFDFLLCDFYKRSVLRAAKFFWAIDPKTGTAERVETRRTRGVRTLAARKSRAN